MFSIFKKKKVIYHVGAWSGNFGDSIIQESIGSNLIALSSYKLEFRYINCQKTQFDEALIAEINKEGDLLLLGGGGLVFYRPQDKSVSGWQWNIPIQLIDTIKVPIAVHAIGYNQFEYDTSDFLPITNSHLKNVVEKASLFSVRNSGSKRDIVKRGCPEERIQVVPDSGMFAKNIPTKVKGLDEKKLKIGFNWTTDRESQTFPEPFLENKFKFLKCCVDLLNYAIREHNAQIVHLGHMGMSFDGEIISFLKDNLIESPLVIDEVMPEIYPPAKEKAGILVDIYRQMDIVLGMRGHSNIVSFGQHVPHIGLGSHRKVRYFLEDTGRSEFFFDVRSTGDYYSFDKMKNKLDYLVENRELHVLAMKNEYNLQRKKFDEFNKNILSLLDKK